MTPGLGLCFTIVIILKPALTEPLLRDPLTPRLDPPSLRSIHLVAFTQLASELLVWSRKSDRKSNKVNMLEGSIEASVAQWASAFGC
ncbi:hypothetical protein EVAR_76506_1 [Eumeta japonica]|uniref:Secreted protein n=1 Tax=Eumeta variegata TaxID=151549 RepID=A0A4C1T4M8_EUMVA|nr:hypothetical protein EVAR_76506_1 [Eumeta japonica]